MSEANDLIERAEKESGCRVDENGHDNMAMAMSVLVGACARALGQSSFEQKDDMAVGTVILKGVK